MRLIDADALIAEYDRVHIGPAGGARKLMEDAPTVDAVEVVHGEWELHLDGSGTCNRCNFTSENVWDFDTWQNYCGHCGAKMDGERKDVNDDV